MIAALLALDAVLAVIVIALLAALYRRRQRDRGWQQEPPGGTR